VLETEADFGDLVLYLNTNRIFFFVIFISSILKCGRSTETNLSIPLPSLVKGYILHLRQLRHEGVKGPIEHTFVDHETKHAPLPPCTLSVDCMGFIVTAKDKVKGLFYVFNV
jgi:hypothetical protein